MNSRRTIYLILTLLTLTFAGFAVAQTTYGQGTSNPGSTDNTSTVTGTVISFEPGRLVVATKDGERTFLVDNATVRPTTLNVNLPVMVQFASESGGDRAVRVTENTGQSAASQTPGGSTTGNDSWPGAANQDDDVDANTGDRADAGTTGTTGSTMTDTTTGTTGSTYGSTGTTGSTTGSMDTATGTTDTTTGSTYAGTADQTAERDTGGIDSSGYQDQDTLPATGSELPLVGLLGLLAFGGAAVLRLTR